MTRKVTVNVYMTLDGHGEFPDYSGSNVRRSEPSEQFLDMWVRRYDDVDTVVFGRRSYEGHQSHFSEESLRSRNSAKYLFDYRHFLDRCQKVVLSRKLKSTDWEKSRIMKGEISRVVSKLRKEKGKNIIIDGGPSTIRECLKDKVADDYRFLVMPVIYGRGNRYWGPLLKQETLELASAKTMKDGELLLHYNAVRD